jgi:hypothetical protein
MQSGEEGKSQCIQYVMNIYTFSCRYIVCSNLRFSRPQTIIDYLLKVNEALAEEHAQSKRVNSIVERGKMESDEAFIDYMKMRNMK